ncbi:hypothetical protein SEA_KILKOR_51 [Mycobacterium phage KilKor]|uniref:Uncharacterized protein n=2 Tax=Fishburnevirus TaxID=1983734 RepID=A0A6B9SYX7_9CAUD|nr:hypothetical protein I5J38_gp50 [Mycobacterium phage Willsammy]YP_009964306.1 hypothetical protein I5J39_gp51 [Mycobacterium phage Megiddo]YP_010001352.1 hypothetical protein J1N47_gp51 [Mycobacterium phage KilKor]QHB41318.1 hypothetical protein SEA_PHALM_51 [Mycobacterium phage Phalm]QHB41475.1 hypothetical protein SEA_GLASKE_51 [Mycobacterium phage Glaske]QHJ86309.1 hypothetical protein SEA_CACTUSJACK_51 [Mycobacterium phage CactusJack]QIG57644.1 hypothetical protein SEA_STRESSBALL_51 [M
MLIWSYHRHVQRTQTAVGRRGTYSVQRVGDEWLLQGAGHDGLDLLELPPGGKEFAALDAAKTWAGELDRAPSREWQVSGA